MQKKIVCTEMIWFIAKRLGKVFLFSFVWIALPSAVLFIPEMEKEKAYNESQLSSYSISVQEYQRSDGTNVSAYKRRPSGSVNYDAPYKTKIKNLETRINFLTLLSIITLIWLTFSIVKEISNAQRNFEEHMHKDLISKLDFNFNELILKPTHLINRLISKHSFSAFYKCAFCKKSINTDEFHYSDLTERKTQRICLNCMSTRILKFDEELSYVKKFKNKLSDFTIKCEELQKFYYPKSKLNIKIIENNFYETVKSVRIKKYKN